jgi:hypothetical protein
MLLSMSLKKNSSTFDYFVTNDNWSGFSSSKSLVRSP